MDSEPAWDALDRTSRLQEAVRVRDRGTLHSLVSDRMIWVKPDPDNRDGKREWIEASCAVAWDRFDILVCRELDLGGTRLVEAWIGLQRQPTEEEREQGKSDPIAGQGVVVDVWTIERGDWRLVSRQPQARP